jgi:hypothetical protein
MNRGQNASWPLGLTLLLIVLFATLNSPRAHAGPDADAILIGTFDRPVYAVVAPGRPDLLFVVEQPGRVRILQDEVPLEAPFSRHHRYCQFHPGG